MPRSRQKPYALCTQTAPVLYRIKHDAAGAWIFACPICWSVVRQNNPHYAYGGTWKAKKRD